MRPKSFIRLEKLTEDNKIEKVYLVFVDKDQKEKRIPIFVDLTSGLCFVKILKDYIPLTDLYNYYGLRADEVAIR